RDAARIAVHRDRRARCAVRGACHQRARPRTTWRRIPQRGVRAGGTAWHRRDRRAHRTAPVAAVHADRPRGVGARVWRDRLPRVPCLAGARLGRVDEGADVPVVELALLRAVPLTAALPGPELEQLARALEPVDVDNGVAVFHQGDYGDRFYLICNGEFDVLD